MVFKKGKINKMRKLFSAILLVCLIVPAAYASTRSQLRQGGKFYQDEKYGSALNVYQNILKKNPANQRALFNAGNAYYRLHEYTQAEETYKKAAELSGDYEQSALYNLGNAYYHAGNIEQAKAAYQAALLKNPQDKEAAHNLQLLIQEQEQQQQQNKNQNNQDNQDKQSDNQNQQNQDGKGQTPQQPQSNQDKSGQLSKQDADRVMSMAKENEPKPATMAPGNSTEQMVDKDW